MKKSVLITGTSSGIGLDAALYFAKKGWQVMATMRQPEKRETPLKNVDNVSLCHLDVTDYNSIEQAIKTTMDAFGKIDAVVNNAGYALTGPFEEATHEQVARQFDTNVFGLMAVCRSIIPVFRDQQSGTIINVTSLGGRVIFPLYSLYHGTKWAVEGFSESLRFELKKFNIKVKIIEPGIVKTDFYSRSMEKAKQQPTSPYAAMVVKADEISGRFVAMGSLPIAVSKAIFKAACSTTGRLRYPVGIDAHMLLTLRKILPDWLFHRFISLMTGA